MGHRWSNMLFESRFIIRFWISLKNAKSIFGFKTQNLEFPNKHIPVIHSIPPNWRQMRKTKWFPSFFVHMETCTCRDSYANYAWTKSSSSAHCCSTNTLRVLNLASYVVNTCKTCHLLLTERQRIWKLTKIQGLISLLYRRLCVKGDTHRSLIIQ